MDAPDPSVSKITQIKSRKFVYETKEETSKSNDEVVVVNSMPKRLMHRSMANKESIPISPIKEEKMNLC